MGGAIYFAVANHTISYCHFKENAAIGGLGGDFANSSVVYTDTELIGFIDYVTNLEVVSKGNTGTATRHTPRTIRHTPHVTRNKDIC